MQTQLRFSEERAFRPSREVISGKGQCNMIDVVWPIGLHLEYTLSAGQTFLKLRR
jgi:hypothetical protein